MDFTQQLFSDAQLIIGQFLFWVVLIGCVAAWFGLARVLASQAPNGIDPTEVDKLGKIEAKVTQAAGTAMVIMVLLGAFLAYLLLPLWSLSAAILMVLGQIVLLGLAVLGYSVVLRRNR